MENVPGMASNRKKGFDERNKAYLQCVIGTLVSLGYNVVTSMIVASHYGDPQGNLRCVHLKWFALLVTNLSSPLFSEILATFPKRGKDSSSLQQSRDTSFRQCHRRPMEMARDCCQPLLFRMCWKTWRKLSRIVLAVLDSTTKQWKATFERTPIEGKAMTMTSDHTLTIHCHPRIRRPKRSSSRTRFSITTR